jgi:large subunit ribosomal protein L11
MEFVKAFNAQTSNSGGVLTPAIITVYADRSFTFITKTPPASTLLKIAAGLDKASGEPNREKVGTVTWDQVREIAETKLTDLNTELIKSAMQQIAGTARSMGLLVQD